MLRNSAIIDASLSIFVGGASFICAVAGLWLALRLLSRVAIAVPNERSSHKKPIPQIGGITIIPIFLLLVTVFSVIVRSFELGLIAFIYAPLALAVIGFFDDRYGLPILLRLTMFIVIIGCVLIWAPELQGVRADHHWIVLLVLGFAALAFMNITNFMDGIDGMLVVEFVPFLFLLWVFCSNGQLTAVNSNVPVVLLGILLGFCVFNWPPARLFMGDAGSLPLGFLAAFLLVQLAIEKNPVSAVLPILYFVFDGSITLVQRILRREKFWHAHRQHAYQRAMDSGQSVKSILVRVASTNIFLCLLSYLTLDASLQIMLICSILGFLLVLLLLLSFGRNRSAA